MEIEWTDTDPATGERRFVSARKFARVWRFRVRFKRRTNWQPVADVTREMWETLLDALERRYPRETASDEDLAAVRKILANFRPPPEVDVGSSSPQRHEGQHKEPQSGEESSENRGR